MWTLDYPPLFAYFEYLLASIASALDVDPGMLEISADPYKSTATTYFQRLSVMATDVVLIVGAVAFLRARDDSQAGTPVKSGQVSPIVSLWLVALSPGVRDAASRPCARRYLPLGAIAHAPSCVSSSCSSSITCTSNTTACSWASYY